MRITLIGMSLVTLLMVAGCGDDDADSSTADPATACKAIVAETCSKYFGCFTEAELSLAAATIGNNESDCRTKLGGTSCTAQKLKCDSGKTYSASKASECLDQYKSLSCDEISDPATADPAACEQICQ
jgi:hypothetical protein